MGNEGLSVREMQQSDINLIADYWLNADHNFLQAMGADVSKLPAREEWISMLTEQLHTPVAQKKSYCIIWVFDDVAIGHSNINKIVFGDEAYMHLHLWNTTSRSHGYGSALVKLTLPFFFKHYQLKKLYCEPYALNPSPNKTLAKVGFNMVKQYVTTPGWLNFEQPVNLWEMTREHFEELV